MGILAVILGIVAIGCAFLAPFLFGVAGGIAVGVVAAVAIVLAFLKRTKDKKGGIPGIIIGFLAVFMAVIMTFTYTTMFSEVHKKAVELKPEGLWAQASEDVSGGLVGILTKLPHDEAGMDALLKEMDEINALAAK